MDAKKFGTRCGVSISSLSTTRQGSCGHDDDNQPERYIQTSPKTIMRLCGAAGTIFSRQEEKENTQEHPPHSRLSSSHFFKWRDRPWMPRNLEQGEWCFNIIIGYYKVLRPRQRQPTRKRYTNVTIRNNKFESVLFQETHEKTFGNGRGSHFTKPFCLSGHTIYSLKQFNCLGFL